MLTTFSPNFNPKRCAASISLCEWLFRLCLHGLLLWSYGLLAAEPDPHAEDGVPPAVEVQPERFDWLVEQRNSWASDVAALGRYVDGFLGGEEAANQRNGSFVKIGLYQVWQEGGDLQLDPRFRFRLDLPRTQDRFSLVIENQSPEFLSPAERSRQNVIAPADASTTPSSGYFRFIADQERWRLKGDIGVRFRFPLQPFVRGRAETRWNLAEDWDFDWQTVTYYEINGDGLGFDQNWILGWRISPRSLQRFRTEAQWTEEKSYWEFAEVFSYSRVLNDRSVISQDLGYTWITEPSFRSDSYFATFTWRYRLYRDWLFAEVSPSVVYPYSSGFQDEASLTVGVEVIFAE